MAKKSNLEYQKEIKKNYTILEKYEILSNWDIYFLNEEELLEVKSAIDFLLDKKRSHQLEEDQKETLKDLLPIINDQLEYFKELFKSALNT